MPRLLLADDDRLVLSALTAQLRDSFEIVGGAASADEAIELAEWRDPDVALIDVQMPAGGGVQAAIEIRVRAPRVAIVAMSADESEASVREMLDAGAVAYLRKGTSADELSRVLTSAIETHASLG